MTVCIGVLCDNRQGAILVADRMITSGLDITFEHPVSNKVARLSGNCYALTSGNAYAHTELFDSVKVQTGNRVSTSVEEFVENIKLTYQKLRQKQIIERYLMPRGFDGFLEFYNAQARGLSETVAVSIFSDIEKFNYGLSILISGLSPACAHLYIVTDPGTSSCIDSLGFHVIGSGLNLAYSSLIASRCHPELSHSDALLVALDAKMTSENAPGVGQKTDVTLILPAIGGAENISFSDDDIKRMRELCKVRRGGDDNSYINEIETMIARIRAENAAVSNAGQPAIIPSGDGDDARAGKQAESGPEGAGTVPAPDQVPHENSSGAR